MNGQTMLGLQNAWRVYLGGELVATVELADREVGMFREQLVFVSGDRSVDMRLEAWENGTLSPGPEFRMVRDEPSKGWGTARAMLIRVGHTTAREISHE